MDYAHHEFQGRAECPKCRRTIREEYRVQDQLTGDRIGSCEVTYPCGCLGASRKVWARGRSSECKCNRCNFEER
jgi:hypothetical protein